MHNPKIAKELKEYAKEIEQQVMSKCKLNPNEINNETIASYIEELKKYDLIQKGINRNIEER